TALLHRELHGADRLLRLLLHGDRVQPDRPGRQHEEVRRLHPGRAARQEDGRVHRPDLDADHPAGRPVPGVDLGVAGLSDPLVQRAVLLRRHEPPDRRRRGARYGAADGVASAHAELRGLPEEVQVALERIRKLSVRIAFLGPPGAGKGTQARDLGQERGVLHLATGDMLREAVAAQSPLGREAKSYMDQGALVPDDVIVRMMGERLGRADAQRGFILDGFPRTIAQAEALAKLLKDLGQTLDTVVYFDVSEPELLRRLTGRRGWTGRGWCGRCGPSYHRPSNPPGRGGVCDTCGGELSQRDDDGEAPGRNRLQVYQRQTAPLLDYYRQRSMLTTVAGEGPLATIRDAIRKAAGGGR